MPATGYNALTIGSVEISAKGGALSGPGPTIAGGMLFMNSGDSAAGGTGAGNVLLAFGVPQQEVGRSCSP